MITLPWRTLHASARPTGRRRTTLASLLGGLALAVFMTCPAHAQAGDEVPFITTPDNVTLAMLELAKVGAQDTLIDLGSGDGRIVITGVPRRWTLAA